MDAPAGFGTLLHRHLVAASLSQETKAERAGLSATAIAALKRGRRTAPRPETVALLSEALQLSQPERAAFIAATGQNVPANYPSTQQKVIVPRGAAHPEIVFAVNKTLFWDDSFLLGRAISGSLVIRIRASCCMRWLTSRRQRVNRPDCP